MPATYQPIASQTLGSNASSVTFSSIAADWTDLVLVAALQASSTVYTSLRFNGDTGNNYSSTYVFGNGSTASSSRQSNTSVIAGFGSNNSGNPVPFALNVFNYANTNVYKTTLSTNANVGGDFGKTVGLWRSTAAITSLTLITSTANSWAAGSTFSLYGIKAA